MASENKSRTVKKGHYVPSRYKQAAEKSSVQSSSLKDKSTFLEHRREDNASKFNKSDEYRGMTSTPTSKGEINLPLDVSAVTEKKGNSYIPHLKEGIVAPITENAKRNLLKKNKMLNETVHTRRPVIVSHKGKKAELYNEKLAEAEIDLHYVHYLQAAYLESEAKKALKMRFTSAVESIHKLFNLVHLYRQKAKSKQQILLLITCLIKVHEHCAKQEEILKPMFDIIPTLEKQYKSISEAVNATKHKLHVKDVLIPESGGEDEVIAILIEMKEFITNFAQNFLNINEIITAADNLKNYVDAAEHISDALKTGLNVLTEAKELVLSEASLLAGCES